MSIACSRLSDSGADAKAKGTRKVGGAVSSRFVFVFARSQFGGPDSEPETGSSVCVRCTPFGVGHFKYQPGVNCICFHKLRNKVLNRYGINLFFCRVSHEALQLRMSYRSGLKADWGVRQKNWICCDPNFRFVQHLFFPFLLWWCMIMSLNRNKEESNLNQG